MRPGPGAINPVAGFGLRHGGHRLAMAHRAKTTVTAADPTFGSRRHVMVIGVIHTGHLLCWASIHRTRGPHCEQGLAGIGQQQHQYNDMSE